MASDDKKIKTSPKSESPSKDKSTSGAESSKAKGSETAAAPSAAAPSKAKDGETVATSPSSYSRGEGQKPVSQAYKDNWNAIFAKKKKKR
jgi:hypothetical protein